MPRKTGVDKARGGVGQKAQSAKGRFTFQTARQVIRKGELLQGGSKYKLTRVQHERFTLRNFDLSGQIRHVTLRVDVGVLRVIKNPEVLVARVYIDGFDTEYIISKEVSQDEQ